MELEHSFTVPAGVDAAWATLLDVERIAPCMPGATLETVHGDEFTGRVKVKVGPITITYAGNARFADKDENAHTVTIEASGKEARGTGTAAATVRAALQADGEASTKVVVKTDLNITGRPAQFGRGVMNDVGNKLIGQFADCLGRKMAEPAGGGAEAEAEGAAAAAAPAAATATAGPSAAAGPGAGTGAASEEPGGAAAAAAPGPALTPPPTSAVASTPAPPPAAGPRRIEPSAPTQPIDLLGTAGAPVLKRLAPVLAALLVLIVVIRLLRRGRH